jgi:pyruvate/2-oxoglutarate/acetoin dehydrogenase E1 component
MTSKCLEAAQQCSLSVEVIDLRILRPLDMEPLIKSARKTKNVLIVEEGWRSGSLSAEISDRIHEKAFHSLQQPVRRLCSQEVPTPYAKHLEEATIPQTKDILSALNKMFVS